MPHRSDISSNIYTQSSQSDSRRLRAFAAVQLRRGRLYRVRSLGRPVNLNIARLADSEIRLTYGRKQHGYLSNVIPRRRRVNRNSCPVNPNNSSFPYQALRRRRATSAVRASRERVAVVGSGTLNNVGPIKACASDSIIPWKVCSTPLKYAV